MLYDEGGRIIIFRCLRQCFFLLGLLLCVFVLCNLDKGFIRTHPDQLRVTVREPVLLAEVVTPLKGVGILDESQKLIQIPYGEADEIKEKLESDSRVLLVEDVASEQIYSVRHLLWGLTNVANNIAQGDIGSITYMNSMMREIPIGPQIGNMIMKSLLVLIPSLVIGICFSFFVVLLSTVYKRLGNVMDTLFSFLLSIPDFFVVVLLQYGAILIAKATGSKVFSVMQAGSDIPIVIPVLSISLISGLVVYGTLRIAVNREITRPYIQTAVAKGLTRPKIVFHHILPNTTPDLAAVFPRAVAAGISGLVVAEVICDIFGLGGYVLNRDVYQITSLSATCTILAVIVVCSHLLVKLYTKRLNIPASGSNSTQAVIRNTNWARFKYGVAWAVLLTLLVVVVYGYELAPYGITEENKIEYLYSANYGYEALTTPPFAPNEDFWLGTDHRGYDVLSLLLNGAKYTLGFAVLVAITRMIVALPLGLAIGLTGKGQRLLSYLQMVFSSVPTILFVFPILYVLLHMVGQDDGIPQTVLFVLLVIYGVFPLAYQYSQRANHYRNSLFVEAAHMMGASRYRILRHHIFPQIRTEVIFSLLYDFVQVLFLLGQLAVLRIFTGGSEQYSDPQNFSFVLTTSGEWGGMIAYGAKVMRYNPWIILAAGGFLTLSIIIIQFFIKQLEQRQLYTRMMPSRPVRVWHRKTVLAIIGLTAMIGTKLYMLDHMPAKSVFENYKPDTAATVPLQTRTEEMELMVEEAKKGAIHVVDEFTKYLSKGDWPSASAYLENSGGVGVQTPPPSKLFAAWIHALTQEGYQIINVGNPEPSEGNPYQFTVEVTLKGKYGEKKWGFTASSHAIIDAQEK